MNHFISGILKIVLLEGSIALLIIDAVAGDRFEKVRLRAHAVLAGLMVFAWANYGSLRYDTDWLTVMSSLVVILVSGFAIGFAFDPKREERHAAWRARIGERPADFRFNVFLGVAGLGLLWRLTAGRAATVPLWLETNTWWMVGVVVVALALASSAHGWARSKSTKEPAFLRQAKPIAVALVVVLSGGWVTAGVMAGRLPLIHAWEQYHFVLGARYQREVGWFNLYKATILADRETVNVLSNLPTTRDLTNFEEVPIATALADAQQVRARFSDERWEAFKADWTQFTQVSRINWTQVMNDHGNSNSPAWALLAAPIARMVPITAQSQAFLGWIDMLLMLGLWLIVWQTFGHRVASIGLFFWAVPPNSFDFLSGSFLRWDWLFALGVSVCLLKQRRYELSGGFFGFAVATKLFPLFFGVALGLRALVEWRETKVFRKDYLHFVRGAAIAGALSVALSAAAFGVDSWKEYAQRIQVAQVEKFYAIQYSLKTVYLQHAAGTAADWAQTIFPGDLKQRQNEVRAEDYAVGFFLAKLAFTALVLVLIRRADDVEAFTLGPLLVFTWLTVNMYYWNMLGLLALGLAQRTEKPNQRASMGLFVGLHVSFMVYFLYQHLNRGLTEAYAVAWLWCVLLIGVAAWEYRDTRKLTLGAAGAHPPTR